MSLPVGSVLYSVSAWLQVLAPHPDVHGHSLSFVLLHMLARVFGFIWLIPVTGLGNEAAVLYSPKLPGMALTA